MLRRNTQKEIADMVAEQIITTGRCQGRLRITATIWQMNTTMSAVTAKRDFAL
jgi:hypothetical protein